MLENILGRAQVIDPTSIDSDKIGFGATVTLHDLDSANARPAAGGGEPSRTGTRVVAPLTRCRSSARPVR